MAPDCKLALASHERLTLTSVRSLMREDGRDSAFAIETVNLVFPGSAAIFRPLKWQGAHLPVLRIEKLQCPKGGAQDLPLLTEFPRLPGRTAQRKIKEAGPWGFDSDTRLPQYTHA